MIPQPYEYLALLGVYAVIILTTFLPQVLELVSSKRFWASVAVFAAVWTVFDAVGIRLEMWIFSDQKTLGLQLLRIPVEEFAAFFLIQLNTLAAWKAFGGRRRDRAETR